MVQGRKYCKGTGVSRVFQFMLSFSRVLVALCVAMCSSIALAQFLPEDQIPLDIQQQIIADVIAEHGTFGDDSFAAGLSGLSIKPADPRC